MKFQDQLLRDDNLLKSIKVQKEHAQRGVDKLLEQISEEGKFFDQMRYLGSKYESRMKEFEALKVENSQLKWQTKKIHDQLALLRNSLQDSGFKDEDFLNKISVDRGKVVDASFNALSGSTSAREQMRSRLDAIKQMKYEANSQYAQQFSEYDDLLKSVIRFLQLSSNTKELIREMKPNQGEQAETEMVVVPRRRYQTLIEIYATNMADLSAKELERHLVTSKQSQFNSLFNSKEQSPKIYKQKYSNIVNEPNLEITSLQIFFRKLSAKFGFQKQWQRYHTCNANEAVQLKAKIDVILKQSKIGSNHIEKPPQNKKNEQLCNESSLVYSLRTKLDNLTSELPFSKKQKQCWTLLSTKIRDNELINMPKVMLAMRQLNSNQQSILINRSAELIHSILSQFVTKLDQLLTDKNKKQILNLSQIQKLLEKSALQTNLKQKLSGQSPQNLWKRSKSISQEYIKKIFEILNPYLKFASTGDIYRSLRAAK